jgi:hypothetical protein
MRRVVLLIALAVLGFFPVLARAAAPSADAVAFPPPLASYNDSDVTSVWSVLVNRVHAEPFNLVATIIFLLAIVHTFLAPQILKLSHRVQHQHEEKLKEEHGDELHEKVHVRFHQSIPAAVLHFLGEIEAVFGLWVIPLAVAIVFI